jgi:quercetin dioxygenase-like cupin family protein
MMYFHDPAERPFKETAPGIHLRSFWGEKMTLAVVNLDANAVLPTHSHPHEQGSYVLEGELEFTIEGQAILAKAGEIVIIPGNAVHSAKVGPAPTKVLDVFCPVREEFKY